MFLLSVMSIALGMADNVFSAALSGISPTPFSAGWKKLKKKPKIYFAELP